MKQGILYIVATPIGNYQDITLRAINTLRSASAVVCEELRLGSTLLKKIGIEQKEILTLNEHNEDQQSEEENWPQDGGDGFWKHAHQSRENGIGDSDTNQAVGTV